MCECCGGDCRLMDKQKELSDAYKKIYDNFDDFVNMVRKDVDPFKDNMKSDFPNFNPRPDTVKKYMLPNEIIHKLQDIGRIEEKLLRLTEDPIFEHSSKHDTYWHSKDEEASDKLDDLRMKMNYINEKLWDVIGIIRKDEQEF
jgi:hypothetical protein